MGIWLTCGAFICASFDYTSRRADWLSQRQDRRRRRRRKKEKKKIFGSQNYTNCGSLPPAVGNGYGDYLLVISYVLQEAV